MRTNKGVDKGSVAINRFRVDQPVSIACFNHERLISAISILWVRVVDQSHLAGVSQAVGISIRVGMRTFSIVAG